MYTSTNAIICVHFIHIYLSIFFTIFFSTISSKAEVSIRHSRAFYVDFGPKVNEHYLLLLQCWGHVPLLHPRAFVSVVMIQSIARYFRGIWTSWLTLWRPLLPYGYSYHPVPDRVKPSFVIFDIRALWRSGLSVRVPGCQKLQMTS